MKTVVVTGADGFIGKRLTDSLLAQGVEVYAVGVNENVYASYGEKLHFIKAYFEDYATLKEKLPKDQVDVFYHFAWNGVFGDAFKDYEKQLNNCKYACDALMIAVAIGCKKFVLASTVNVLESRRYMGMDAFEPRYTNIYAMSKLSAEMMCKTLAFQNKIEFNCGLIAMVYGEYNGSAMIPNVVMGNLLNDRPSSLVPAETPYDLIYVQDVADGFIAIGKAGINQKTYYVGHSELSTFGEIFTKMRDILNPKAELRFGVYPSNNAIDYSLIDIDALQRDTGFAPQSDFKESVLATANWLKTVQ